MKWRIIQRVDGRYEIKRKDYWFMPWKYRYGSFSQLDDARITLNMMIANRQSEIMAEKGMKFLKVIEEIGE